MTTRMYYEQIGEHMKPGVHENFLDGFEIAEMSRYNTLQSEDEQNRLKEYIYYKKEGHCDNYDITGEILIPECLEHHALDPHQQCWQEQCTRRQDEAQGSHGGADERKI